MARGRTTSLTITLTPEERRTLLAWQRARIVPSGVSRRARMILLLADGVAITAIAATVGISRRFVYKWAQRFLAQGVAGLVDRPRRGRRPRQGPPQEPPATGSRSVGEVTGTAGGISSGGGGILNNGGIVTLTNSPLVNNSVTDSSGGGISSRPARRPDAPVGHVSCAPHTRHPCVTTPERSVPMSHARRVLVPSFLSLVLLLSLMRGSAHTQAPLDISADLLRTIDLPNATGEYHMTALADINTHGLIVGGFGFPSHAFQEGSFSLSPEGTVKLFTCDPTTTWTQVRGVNNHPAMVGWCYTRVGDQATVHGFYRSESGRMTPLRVPGAVLTEPEDLNDRHVVVGFYVDSAGIEHGFRWTRSTGTYETLDAPFPDAFHTVLFGINNAGDMSGFYFTRNFVARGVIVRNGHWRRVTAPGIDVGTVYKITEQGQVLGHGGNENGVATFLFGQGTAQPLSLPLGYLWGESITAINPSGLVVGHFDQEVPVTDERPCPCPTHGFIARLQALQVPAVSTLVAQAMAERQVDQPSIAGLPTPQGPREDCPDRPVPPGSGRSGPLRMSWVGCRR